MRRPVLEIASWVAGILSAVVALYLLVFPPGQQSSLETPAVNEQRPPSPAPPQIKSAPIEHRDTVGLRAAIEAARNIRVVSTRDDELYRLVGVALKRNEFTLGVDAARALTVVPRRDKAFEVLTCWTMHFGDSALARSVASMITTSSIRDRAFREISSVASTKAGEGENDIRCPAL